MFQPYLITKNGEIRRQVLLQEAELARQIQQVKSSVDCPGRTDYKVWFRHSVKEDSEWEIKYEQLCIL